MPSGWSCNLRLHVHHRLSRLSLDVSSSQDAVGLDRRKGILRLLPPSHDAVSLPLGVGVASETFVRLRLPKVTVVTVRSFPADLVRERLGWAQRHCMCRKANARHHLKRNYSVRSRARQDENNKGLISSSEVDERELLDFELSLDSP